MNAAIRRKPASMAYLVLALSVALMPYQGAYAEEENLKQISKYMQSPSLMKIAIVYKGTSIRNCEVRGHKLSQRDDLIGDTKGAVNPLHLNKDRGRIEDRYVLPKNELTKSKTALVKLDKAKPGKRQMYDYTAQVNRPRMADQFVVTQRTAGRDAIGGSGLGRGAVGDVRRCRLTAGRQRVVPIISWWAQTFDRGMWCDHLATRRVARLVAVEAAVDVVAASQQWQ